MTAIVRTTQRLLDTYALNKKVIMTDLQEAVQETPRDEVQAELLAVLTALIFASNDVVGQRQRAHAIRMDENAEISRDAIARKREFQPL